MENFFDVATPEEIGHHFPFAVKNAQELDALRRELKAEPDRNLGYLASLYYCRGDTEKADACLDRIEDEQHRLDIGMMLYECRES